MDADFPADELPMEGVEASLLHTSTDANFPNTNAIPAALPGKDVVLYLDKLLPSWETTRKPHFDGPGRWRRALDFRGGDGRSRSIEPASDPTIVQVLGERESWVEELCKAIVHFTPTKREQNELSQYNAKEVEAAGRRVFVCFLVHIIGNVVADSHRLH
jgi:hypothetical protein